MVTVLDDKGRKWRLGERPMDSHVEYVFKGDNVGTVEQCGTTYALMKRGEFYFIRNDNTGTGHRVFLERTV